MEPTFHSTCQTCNKLVPNAHFDCERETKAKIINQDRAAMHKEILAKVHQPLVGWCGNSQCGAWHGNIPRMVKETIDEVFSSKE